MIALKLDAKGAEQTLIKEYLQNNVSEVLAEKIRNGVRIAKDGKTLINRKDLDGFMDFAYGEAKNLAEKVSLTRGVRSACVKSDTVFGWAVHYFEEDSIEGKLFHEDGTEYKPPKPVISKTSGTAYIPPAPKQKPQISLFDMLGDQTNIRDAGQEACDESDDDVDPAVDNEADYETDLSVDTGADDCAVVLTETGMPDGDYEVDIPRLTRISETQYVDSDGVVYDAAEVKADTDTAEQATLLRLVGNAVVVR